MPGLLQLVQLVAQVFQEAPIVPLKSLRFALLSGVPLRKDARTHFQIDQGERGTDHQIADLENVDLTPWLELLGVRQVNVVRGNQKT